MSGIRVAAQIHVRRISRKSSTLSAKSQASDETSFSSDKIREFDEIPEAKGLPFIGTLLDYTPLRGFKVTRIGDLWKKRHDQYGNIYREKYGGKNQLHVYFNPLLWEECGTDGISRTYREFVRIFRELRNLEANFNYCGEGVFCRTKEDTEKLFRAEGRLPFRTDLEGLRIIKQMMGLPDTVGNLRGEEWYRMRQPLNEFLMKSKMVWKYAPDMLDITEELCTYIEKHRDEKGEVPNFDSVLDKWAFEMSGSFSFNRRFGLIRGGQSDDIVEAFDGMKKMMELAGAALYDNRFWKNKDRTELERDMKRTGEVFSKLISEQRDSKLFGESVLGQLYATDSLSEKERESLVFDVLLGSVETTSRSSALMLYCLTLKSEVQEKLRNEVLSVFNSKSEISGRDIDGMVYVNAFLKEVTRLYPFAHVMSRILPHDIVLSGYRVPAGKRIINTSNSTQNRNPEYYKNPNEFLPERWIEHTDVAGKFTSTGSFGLGARACPGRRFAMQELRVLLMQMLKNFKVEYKYEPMVSLFRLTGSPSEESRFTFTPLKD